jgi:hypothetical protein
MPVASLIDQEQGEILIIVGSLIYRDFEVRERLFAGAIM